MKISALSISALAMISAQAILTPAVLATPVKVGQGAAKAPVLVAQRVRVPVFNDKKQEVFSAFAWKGPFRVYTIDRNFRLKTIVAQDSSISTNSPFTDAFVASAIKTWPGGDLSALPPFRQAYTQELTAWGDTISACAKANARLQVINSSGSILTPPSIPDGRIVRNANNRLVCVAQ